MIRIFVFSLAVLSSMTFANDIEMNEMQVSWVIPHELKLAPGIVKLVAKPEVVSIQYANGDESILPNTSGILFDANYESQHWNVTTYAQQQNMSGYLMEKVSEVFYLAISNSNSKAG